MRVSPATAILLLCCVGSSTASRVLTQSSQDVKKMGETHSGTSSGVVKPAAGTQGAEKKIGELVLSTHCFLGVCAAVARWPIGANHAASLPPFGCDSVGHAAPAGLCAASQIPVL